MLPRLPIAVSTSPRGKHQIAALPVGKGGLRGVVDAADLHGIAAVGRAGCHIAEACHVARNAAGMAYRHGQAGAAGRTHPHIGCIAHNRALAIDGHAGQVAGRGSRAAKAHFHRLLADVLQQHVGIRRGG
jgi:hypothetical protein